MGKVGKHTETTQAIALVAAEHAKELDAESSKQRCAAEASRAEAAGRVEELRGKLVSLELPSQQLHRELEEAETTQRELLRQVGQLSQQIEMMRQRRAEQQRTEDALRTDLQRLEASVAATIATEDEAQHRTEAAQALATSVADLASGLAAQREEPDDQKFRIEEVSAGSSRADALATELVKRETKGLEILATTADACINVAEERERSRIAMAELGVPASTLESDVVGEAEIAQSLEQVLAEFQRCSKRIETLCTHFDREMDGSAVAVDGITVLKERLKECEEKRIRLATLAALEEDEEDAVLVDETLVPAEVVTKAHAVEDDPFLLEPINLPVAPTVEPAASLSAAEAPP